ncbi:MAG: epoxyqueuosine reductase QueH [Eggerthellaceae bacterium]|jgi:predicted adenine nucleotide alpha hydrolase (AANH) superfamily ATPase|nr:epoxyqueuosine reductase QueH [Eggerthellaceae bacterium]MDR2715957.1 epoxyqueuosine reductase QueH [Coriobacteriaceae bacterium]
MKLLLHACCGPCSLEPVRLLAEAGHEVTLAFMNANIQPADEYARRRDTLAAWAGAAGIPVVEGASDPTLWEAAVAPALAGPRQERCRACYRLRFEEVARVGAEGGFEAVSTTLSISPYQLTGVIAEELGRAAAAQGLACVFEDFRPFYPEATRRSRALGMYRQNFCGCRPSADEAAAERAERRRARKEGAGA